jgi:raffinose/stachyose/melibiose transport system substrate-binding protein
MDVTRRVALKWAGGLALSAGALSSLIEACGGGTSTSTSSAKKVTSGTVRWRTDVSYVISDQKVLDAGKVDLPKLIVESSPVDYTAAGFTAMRLSIQSRLTDLLVAKSPKFLFLDPLLKSKLLRPLDDYYEAYNWKHYLNQPSTKHATRDGHIWMATTYLELPGLTYRKSTLNKLGLQPPQTWADFLMTLQELKGPGQIPITVGTRGFSFLMLLHNQLWSGIDPKSIEQVIFGNGKWTDPAPVAAAGAMVELWDKGYIDKDALSIQLGDAAERFLAGKAALNVTGSWFYATMKKQLGDDWDMLTPPGPGGKPTWSVGEDQGMVIPANAKDADAAAAWLNYMVTGNGVKALQDAGNLVASNAFAGQAIPQVAHLPTTTSTSSVYLFGWLPTATEDAWQQGVSSLFDKTQTPAQWCAQVQKAWEKDISNGNVPSNRGQLL